MDQRTILNKVDFAVSNLISTGGYLNPIQGATFLRMMQEQPTLLREVRMVPMNAPTMEINKIGFGSRILRAAPAPGSALPSSSRVAPTTEKVELVTSKVKAECQLPYDVLEDAIERGGLENTLMEMITERASLDLEELIILGDTDSADTYLALYDGLLVQATSHVVDYTDEMPQITKEVFKAGYKAMPNKYLRNRSLMRYYTSPDVETEYADYLANRSTILGDTRVSSNFVGALAPYGVPIQTCALMPDDSYIFTYPKNVIFGVQRDMMIETDRDIRSEMIVIVLTMRCCLKFEEEDAVVKCIGLNPNDLTTTTA